MHFLMLFCLFSSVYFLILSSSASTTGAVCKVAYFLRALYSLIVTRLCTYCIVFTGFKSSSSDSVSRRLSILLLLSSELQSSSQESWIESLIAVSGKLPILPPSISSFKSSMVYLLSNNSMSVLNLSALVYLSSFALYFSEIPLSLN